MWSQIAYIVFIISLVLVMFPLLIRVLVELRDFKDQYHLGEFNNKKLRQIQRILERIALVGLIYVVVYGIVWLIM